MILDSEEQRTQLRAVILAAPISGTLEEVTQIASGVQSLLRSVMEAPIAVQGEES